MKPDIPPQIKGEEIKKSNKSEYYIFSEDVFDTVENINFDPKIIISEALDENGNICDMTDIFIDTFWREIENKLKEKYNEEQIGSISFNEWYWRERDYMEELANRLSKNEFKKDIDKAIIIKSIVDFSSDSLEDDNNFVWDNSIKVAKILFNKLKNNNTSILEKSLLKKAIYDLYYVDCLNHAGYFGADEFLKKVEEETGVLNGVDYFDDEFFDKSKLKFNKIQKDLIVRDNNNIDSTNFFDESYIDNGRDLAKTTGNYFNEDNARDFLRNQDEEFLTDFVVSKLSPDTVGVYSLRGRLIGWQKIENLDKEGEEGVVKDFFEIKKECPMNSKEELALFKISSSLYFRDFIQQALNIDLSKLSIENQFYFLNFIQSKTENELSGFKEFIEKSKNEEEKVNKLKTFLSIEQEKEGEKIGDKIIGLGEKLPEEISRKIFAKYGEIINTVDNTEEEIKKIFGHDDIPERVLNSVKETLLKRGAKMLSLLGDKVLDPKFEVNEIEILKELDEIKEETIILGQSYVGLYKEGIKVPIEDITTIRETSTKDLTEERKEELMKIYEKGRPKVTYDKQSHLEFLKEEFKNELNDEDISVVEICFKEATIIIALVDKKDEETLHIGGFTFIEDVKNAVIAEATMSYAFEKFKNYNIKALVDSKNPLLNMYLKRFGFRITKKLNSPKEIKDNGGEIYYEVEKTKDFKIGEKVEEKEELLEEAA